MIFIYKKKVVTCFLVLIIAFGISMINLDKEIITVLNPVGRLKDVPYKILTCESPMKMSEIYESYDDYIQDVAKFEEANFYPLKNELQSLIKEMEAYFSTESEEINPFMDESFMNVLRDKLDECENSIKKLIFNLNKIQSLYEWDY